MSSVSWFEPGLVMSKALGFPTGSEERPLSGSDAEIAAHYPNSCGHLLGLRMKRSGHLSQELWTISAIALDKPGAMA